MTLSNALYFTLPYFIGVYVWQIKLVYTDLNEPRDRIVMDLPQLNDLKGLTRVKEEGGELPHFSRFCNGITLGVVVCNRGDAIVPVRCIDAPL